MPLNPIAQSFQISITDENVSGCYITKVDLYFKQKDTTHGVTIQIRALDSSGQLTNEIVPFSKVNVPTSAINTSSNASVKTTIVFQAPVYLLNNTNYALVIIPDAGNPNTYVFTSVLGQTDIITGKRITTTPATGMLFTSSDNITWSPVQDEDLMFTLYRADFTPNSSGTVTFGNEDTDYTTISSETATFTNHGEVVTGESRLTLSGITGGTISAGESLKGASSSANGVVTNVNGSYYRVKVTVGEAYTSGETVSAYYANGTSTGVTASISAIDIPSGKIGTYVAGDSSSNSTLYITNSNGLFETGEQIRGTDSGTTANINTIYDLSVDLYNFQPSVLVFNGTSVAWKLKQTTPSYSLGNAYTTIDSNDVIETSEKIIASKSNENVHIGSKSAQFTATMKTFTKYLSPQINRNRCHDVIIHNVINNDSTGETGSQGGNALARYVTQKVTLADGQDAEDLNVYLTEYVPPGTSVKVYVKLLNGEDSDSFDDIDWLQLSMTSNSAISDKNNTENFIDFTYGLPSSVMTGTNGAFSYTNSQGVKFTTFKYFSIKIVLLSSNLGINPPRCKDLRAIALQL